MAGLYFGINNSLVNQTVGVNDLVMTLKIPFASGRYKAVLSLYAITLFSADDISTIH